MARWQKMVWGSAVLAAGLTLAGCRGNNGDDKVPGWVSSSPVTMGVTPPGDLPNLSTEATNAAVPLELIMQLDQQRITALSYTPGEGGSPALVRVQGMPSPGLSKKDLYQDIFYGISNALHSMPFRVENEQGLPLIETDSASSKSFRLAKVGGETYFFDKESIRNYQPVKAVATGARLNPLLQAGPDCGWDPDVLTTVIGKQDNRFNEYDMYWNQQMKMKESNHLSSIVFNKGYTPLVIGSLGTTSTKEDIQLLLGKPPFEETTPLSVFGYKLEPFYLFFSGEAPPYEIAVYPRTIAGDTGGPELPELLAANTAETGIRVQQFVNRIREEWPDYETISYDESHLVTYPHRGIRIDSLLGEDSGYKGGLIQLYGNYEGQVTEDIRLPEDAGKLKKLANGQDWPATMTHYFFRLEEDMVFNREKNRLLNLYYTRQSASEEGVPSPNGRMIAQRKLNMVSNKIGLLLLYPDKEQPSLEIHIGNSIWNPSWLSDRYIIFEADFMGIMGYDVLQNKLIELKSSLDSIVDYRLIEVEEGIIRYSDGHTEKDLPYSFNTKGELVLPEH